MKSDKLLNELTRRYETISRLIEAAGKKMAQFPEGRLKIKSRDGHIYYYHVDDTNPGGRLLGKDEEKLAGLLAQKSYVSKILKTAEEEHKVIKYALEKYPAVPVEKLYQTLPEERRALINPIVQTDEEFEGQWLAIPFKPKEIKEGTAFYETMKGERVRSKSEQIIADRLFAKGIPYKYECPLKVGRETYHPDFTILRLSDRQEIYYEHIGKLDDPQYVNDNAPKYNAYYRNGILPGVKLFMTFETSEYPLDMRALDKVIEEQFR